MLQHPLGLADAITLVLLFLLAVFLLGILVGLSHMWWRTRRDRLEQEKEDEVSANARSPEPRGAAHADVTRRLKAAGPANQTRRARDV